MSPTPSSPSDQHFAQTRWSLVAATGVQDAQAARRAMIELCLRYWYPVYAYVRGCGHAPPSANDITRSFFEDLLQRRANFAEARGQGRFRQFLLESLARFLGSDWRQIVHPMPVAEFEQPLAVAEIEARHQRDLALGLSQEQAFQRSYALEVLGTALARLQREAEQAGRLAMFAAMEPFLSAEPAPGQMEELSRQLGIRPLAAVVAMKRLRQRFRELAEAELAETVASAADLAVERAALARALGQA